MKKTWLIITGLLAVTVGFWVLHKPAVPPGDSIRPLKIGVTAGPHARIIEQVQIEAKKRGLELEIVEFNDFILPNEALNQGDIDINSYQHQPFLDEQLKVHGYNIKSIAKTVLMPMGLYSQFLKSVRDIPEGAVIGIPNDPTNAGRALLFLSQLGLIRLKPGMNPTLMDIIGNPKNLKIKELEAPTLVMILPDVTAAVINTDWVVLAKIDPRSALAIESTDTPYTNVIAVRTEHEQNEDIKKFVNIYQSDMVKQFILQTFRGAVIPGWE